MAVDQEEGEALQRNRNLLSEGHGTKTTPFCRVILILKWFSKGSAEIGTKEDTFVIPFVSHHNIMILSYYGILIL